MLKTLFLTAALIAPNATTEETPATPEETAPVIIQDQTTENAPTAAATEETPETPQLYETPGGLTETAPVLNETFATPEEENPTTPPEYASPEEENPETPPKYATPEEEYNALIETGLLTEEATPGNPEEVKTEWLKICETYEEYTPAPAAAYTAPKATTPNKYIPHDINASDITALNAPYFNKKPFQGVTVINCKY